VNEKALDHWGLLRQKQKQAKKLLASQGLCYLQIVNSHI